jgi:serine/threonine protein phosphatase PrpC
MSQPANESRNPSPLHSTAITDRGLSPKRPLNEDSFLADSERGIFAVADGVGGAEAGEVASKTAIEVLDEAFRHQVDGADIEDLMELAIQRANASIHQMAQEHAKFAMMATTIVALHIDNNIATIGHVGDSRLYRLTPAGQLLRETQDHSVVEEEVRAGRMTAEQAANHPSKNVISRALGAEKDVEVDLKVIEVDDGTEFLLCTDGITRHIPDHEIRQTLIANDDLNQACSELKRLCFERGAEDNLTAVIISIGKPISTAARAADLEKTISPEATVSPDVEPEVGSTTLIAASRKAFPSRAEDELERTLETPLKIEAPVHRRAGVERTMTRLFVFVLVIFAIGAAFYAGRRYRGPIPYLDGPRNLNEQTLAPLDDEPQLRFDRTRRTLDGDPKAWLSKIQTELSIQGIQKPIDSSDPEFLYLYGRACMLTGDMEQAQLAFEKAVGATASTATPLSSTIHREAALALAAVALKSEPARRSAIPAFDAITSKSGPDASPSISPTSSPSTVPSSSP